MPSLALLQALLAAMCFGATTPIAKRLLGASSPLVLAGWMYLGAGLLAFAWKGLRRARTEAPLSRRDLPALAAAVGLGGLAGPLLLYAGLARTGAMAASLLLNLESVLTIGVAVALGERLGRRVAASAGLLVAGAVVITLRPGEAAATPLGVVLVAGACLAWALDNNFTRAVSGKDPAAIVAIKGGVAGPVALSIALATGSVPWGSPGLVAVALGVGALGYGGSLLLFIGAMRQLGAARASACLAAGPFLGAALAIPLLGERPSVTLLAAGALMALGVAGLAREDHVHPHVHEPLEHDHAHVHDAHHQHAHRGDEGPEPHAHPHRHERLAHTHAHTPDLHHRHGHEG